MYVKRVIDGGLLDEWNLQHQEQEVRLGDRISEVNGFTTVDEMKHEFKAPTIKMRMVRYPDFFYAELLRTEGRKLGFKFKSDSPLLPGLRVSEILPGGQMEEINRERMVAGNFHLVVLPGMRIEAANGAELNAAAIAEELRRATVVLLRFRRNEALIRPLRPPPEDCSAKFG